MAKSPHDETETTPEPRTSKPAKQLAVVACMDARLDVETVLDLQPGDAHIVRNAGGVVTDDVIRSLTMSQRLLGTREIVLIHHTDCGMMTITDDEIRDHLESETGVRPHWSPETFSDPEVSIRRSIARLRATPFIPHADDITAYIWDVITGELHLVAADGAVRAA